jgi:hypothetical protein
LGQPTSDNNNQIEVLDDDDEYLKWWNEQEELEKNDEIDDYDNVYNTDYINILSL